LPPYCDQVYTISRPDGSQALTAMNIQISRFKAARLPRNIKIIYQTTPRQIPEDNNIHTDSHDNLKLHTDKTFCSNLLIVSHA
jgi:hypothetical protein